MPHFNRLRGREHIQQLTARAFLRGLISLLTGISNDGYRVILKRAWTDRAEENLVAQHFLHFHGWLVGRKQLCGSTEFTEAVAVRTLIEQKL